MTASPLYPLKFAPLYQYRLWGGRRLGDLLATALSEDGAVQGKGKAREMPRVLACLEGSGQIESCGVDHTVSRGDVWLLPAAVALCTFRSTAGTISLELALPEGP